MSNHRSGVVLLFFVILILRTTENGSLFAIWNATASGKQTAPPLSADLVRGALEKIVGVIIILAILSAMADTPAYPLAIGIEVVALVYVLLSNAQNFSTVSQTILAFISPKGTASS